MKAGITIKKQSMTATLDPMVIAQAKKNLYELAQDNGFVGSFDEFMKSIADDPESLISTDTPNDLKLGSDKKLLSQPNDTDFLAYYLLERG